jgi:acetylornithine/succinyldiaminopimelate/putrescine aminotransferase
MVWEKRRLESRRQDEIPPHRFSDGNILSQMCGNNLMVLKAAPPLMVPGTQVDEVVAANRAVVELAHASTRSWSEAMETARRAAD